MSPSLQLYYQVSVHEEVTGKVIRRGRRLRARSFVVQFIESMRGFWNGADQASITDTGGSARTMEANNPNPVWRVIAGSGVVTFGTRAGTGTTAVVMTDNKLETEIAEGTGSGQLSHGACTVSAHIESSTESSFTIVRSFTNSTGSTVTVTETGIYAETTLSGGGQLFMMLARDVLSSSQAILNGQVLTV